MKRAGSRPGGEGPARRDPGAPGRATRAEARIAHRSGTSFRDESGSWYVLDNAGIIMPAVASGAGTSLFRLEARLDAPVDLEILQAALEGIAVRYPYFNVELKRGFFWYYLEPCRASLCVDGDGSPCQAWNINRRGTRLFRVRCEGNLIACEFSHALTDGSGGISFLKSLVTEYFRLAGVEPGAELGAGDFADIHAPGSTPHEEEQEDAYSRHFKEHLPHPALTGKAWRLSSPRLEPGRYRVISGSIPLKDTLAEARRRGVTLTVLLAAAYLEALQELWLAEPRRPSRTLLSLEIPVNLRKFYPTRTKRNFSLFVLVSQDMRLGRREFDDILSRTHHQMGIEYDLPSISRQITRNVAGAHNVAVRMVPLFIKDFFARILFSKYGENLLSGFLSNLGAMTLPPGPAAHVESFDFIPAPSAGTLTNASMVSWKDRIHIDFGSLARSRELERLFFTRLRKLGLPVRVECRHEEG